ncbi:radical SAM protein [Thermodesulfovibrio yellowstonii]|jgi:uncharacterized protein|uniref:radical SAM protein n=1 Tax=Thermodesulfovibrio yellowstonii TaxID=28262 RepID=UPI003F835A40
MEKIIKSCDVHLFNVRDEYFLYDVEGNKLFSLSKDAYEIARKIIKGERIDENFSIRYIKAERELKKVIDEIEPLTEEEAENRRKILEQTEHKLTGLWLGVAHSCNLGCAYCFANSPRYLQTHKTLMSEDIAFRGIEFMLNQSPDDKEYDLIFFGGEPLLRFDLIRKIIEHTSELSKSDKKFYYSITTNGTLLTKDVFDYLKDNNVSIMLSIDGTEELHNKNRPYKDGRPSWQDIINNISKIPDIGYYIMARVTVTSTKPTLLDIFNNMRSLGFIDVALVEICPNSGEMPVLPSELIPTLKSQYLELAEYLIEAETDPYHNGLKCLSVNMQALRERKRSFYCCSTGISSLYLTPDGDFYPCMRLITEKGENIMGNLEIGVDREKIKSFIQNNIFNKKCIQCWARYICGGGCYGDSFAYGGNIRSVIENYCIMNRFKIEVAAYILKKLNDKNRLPEKDKKVRLKSFGMYLNKFFSKRPVLQDKILQRKGGEKT